MRRDNFKPLSVQMAITYRCNLRCLHCDIWKSKKTDELSSDEWIRVLKRLKNWLGPFRLDISGGEPFLRKDILEIINFCHNNEIQTVVTTNATLFDAELINRLSGIKTLTLNISVDGVNPETHDYLRNTKGTYDKVMDTFLKFKKNKRTCLITMATILMGYNINEVMPLMKKLILDRLADAINFQALDHNFHAPYNPSWFNENTLWPSNSEKKHFLNIMDWIIRIKKVRAPIYNPLIQLRAMRDYFNNPQESIRKAQCNTGNVNFIMNPNGEALLCWNMDPIGNVLYDEPEKIWHSSLAKNRRVQISKCTRTCRILNCNFNEAEFKR